MPETLDPNEVTNVGDPRTEERLSLKPFSQWKAESQAQTGNQLSDLDSLVGYSNYQRLESLKANKYSIEAEKQIQSALAGQIQKRGLLEGKTEEERTQLEDSIFGVPEPSFDESVLAVSSAYPSATPDSPDPDLAAFARYRDFSRNIGEEVGQNDQAGLEELKVAATPAIAKLYDKAQRERVKNGDIPIAIVTNYDEEGKPYKSFYAEDTGDTPAEVAVARALETGAIPPQAAFGAYSTLQKVPGLNVNQIGMRNIQRVKSIASKASTFAEYSGLQDVINDYGDYLIDKEKGDVDAEDETFARQTEARFASYLGMITEDSEEKPTGQSVKQALEELAFDTAVQNGKVSFDEDNLSNNIRFSSAGVPLVHPALVGNSEYFDKALESKEGITAAQKKQLQANRKTFLASNFHRYDDLLSDSPTQGEDWRGYRNKARAEGRNDFEIIDSYLKNPNSFREFSSRMSGIGSSIIDAFGTLGATIPALAGADWAQDYLTETAKKNSARRQVAEAFGRPFGIGQDILEQAAPIVADLAATALLSSVTGGAGGAAYLALRQGGNVTGKAVGKALTASMLQRSVFMEAGEDVATAAARLTDVGDLIKKGTSVADAERVISGYNRFVQSKLNLAAPLFLTSANRSAGGMYGAVYNSLPDTLSKEEKHDQALGAALMAGATTGLITSAFSLAGLGGLENALLKGATAGQLIKALRKVGGPKAVEDIGEDNFKAALAKGMKDTFAKLGLTTAARAKNLAINVGSEAAEEGLDEFVSTFVNDAFTGQDTPLLKRLQTGLHAAFIGGIYGGAIPGIKSAVKTFTPTTQTEEAAFAGARAELAQSVSANLEAAGSPLAAQAVSEILSADVVSSVLAAGPSAIGKSGTAFAGMTRAQAVERLLASAATTASQGDQLVMGSILRDAEGTAPAQAEEAPPSPSPEYFDTTPTTRAEKYRQDLLRIRQEAAAAPAEEAPPSPSPEQGAAPAAAAPAAAAPAAPAAAPFFWRADDDAAAAAAAAAADAPTTALTPTPTAEELSKITLLEYYTDPSGVVWGRTSSNNLIIRGGRGESFTGRISFEDAAARFAAQAQAKLAQAASAPTPTATPGSAQAVADLTAAVPVLDLEEAAESEMTQGAFDFFDDAATVRTAVVPKPSAIEGVQRGLPSVPKGIPAPENDIQRKADDLRFIPEEAQQFQDTLKKKDADRFRARINRWKQVEEKLVNSIRKVFKGIAAPTVQSVRNAVNNSGILQAAASANVPIAFVDGARAVNNILGVSIPTTPKPSDTEPTTRADQYRQGLLGLRQGADSTPDPVAPYKTGKIATAAVVKGMPVVIVDESTVRGKSEEEIVESVRSAIFHASMIRAAAETGAYTSEPVSDILEENGLLGKASSANRSVSQSSSPAEQLSKTVFAVANSEIDLNLNEHPTLRAFLEKVLPVLSFRLKGATPDAPLSQAVENLQTLLEEGEVTGTVTPAPAPALSPASPKLQPRFVYGEDPTMTEQEKFISAKIYEILVSLNAIPRNLEIMFDFSVKAAFRVEGGYLFVNPSEVLKGLINNNLLSTGTDGQTRITDIPRARQVLRQELDHEQIHMATDRALTVDQRERLIAGFKTEELVEMAHAYYAGDTDARDEAIASLMDTSAPDHAEVRARIGDEKIRADVQSLMLGETSEESLAALSENTERKSMYMRYLTKAQFLFRKKLRASGDAAYSAALKRIANAKRDMQNGYIPAQHSHGGIFSPDRPYAGLSQIMRAGMYMNPNEDLPEDLDLDALEVEPGEDVIEVPVNEASLISDEEASVAAFSMFGVGATIENPETTKSKVLGGATVGTRYPKGTKLKAAAELGVNPDNQITLEAAAADKKSYLKNALVLASYPAVQGTIRRQLKDAEAVKQMRGKMTPAQWKVTSGKIKTALKKAKKILKSADEFKQTQRVVDALTAREDAKKELNAFIEGLSSNKNPNNPDNNARDAYWSWFFDQINFTGKGVLTPNKFGKSSLPKVRDALINFIKTDQIAALNESYTPVEGLRKWTPTKKDLQKVLTLSNKREKATLVTDKINVEAKEVRTKIGKDLDFFSAPDEEGSLVDDDIARIIYQSLDEIGEQNLTVLHDIFPESVRIYAKLWYDGANILARQLSGTTAAQTVNGKEVKEVDDVFGGGFIAKAYNERALEKAAAILAVFSPQKDWFMNVSLAHRTMEILSKALTRSSKMTWTPEMSAQFRRRAGEPEEIDDGNGNITFSGGAIPVYKEGTDNEFVLNEDGSRKFINFDPGKSIAAAEAILRAVEGKNFSDIGDPKKTSATYEDPDKKGVMKTISGTALQARFVRMFSEVYHAENYPAINPNGQVGGYAKSPDSGKNIKIAWGGYNTIEKAIRIYTAVGASENYEKDAILSVISNELGGQHKVRSFYNNIVNPAMDGHVTMDTHAIAAILGKPLSGAMAEVSHNFGSNFVGGSGLEGISGTYAANAESYRNVAFKKELRARELQSITWESVRLLFPAKFKRTKGVARINAIWEAYAEETEFTPEPTESDPNPAPVLINTIEDAWNQIIRVVWANTKKGKPVPTLTQLKEYAKIEYLNSVKPEDYNGLGFPSWDTTDIAQKMIALEGEKAVEDVISKHVEIGTYLNDTSSRYSQFGGPSASEQSERDLLSLLRVTKAEGIPIVRTNAALRRGIENLSTRIEGETTDEILEAAVKAKLALSAYGYHGTKIGYSDYTALLPATEMDPALAPSKFGPLEPSFIDFFAKAPVLQSAIRNNPFGFTLNKEGESQLLGYVVAPRKNTEKILSEGFTDDDLRAYIVEHADILSLPGARIGGWYTPETNQFTLDVSFPVEKAEDALTAALAADQDAIWDLQNGYGINTKIKNPDGTYSQTPTLPRVIDGRDANRVIAEVVPTIGDVALFASERSYRDSGRMVLPSDGGPETTGAAAGLDVPTSRIIAEAREVNLSESAPGGSIQGGFGRTQRKGQEGSFGYLTGRFRKITASQAREKMSGYEYTGGEHIVKLDSASTSRVFKYARFADKPFGLPVNTAKTPQAGYLSRVAFGNIFFEDNQRIENVVEDETTGAITGYVVSQPYYSKSRNLSPDETRLILATLGWRKHPKYGQNVYLSQPVRLKDGSEGPRLYLTDVQGDNLFMENTEDGGEILRAPDLIVGVWSDDPAVRDMFPSVAELLELHPDPKEFGISVPSQLDGILAEDKDTADKLKQLKKDAEEEAAMFADLLGAMSGLSDSSTSGSRFSQFGAAQDAEYLALAADPVKNQARLQEMVATAAKAAGLTIKPWYHGTYSKDIEVFDRLYNADNYYEDSSEPIGIWFTEAMEAASILYGPNITSAYLQLNNFIEFKDKASLDKAVEKAGGYEKFRQANSEKDGVSLPTVRVVFNPNQIKSADPVTFDEQGNVIPLSQRFNTGSNDIRFSQFGAAQDAEYQQIMSGYAGTPRIAEDRKRKFSPIIRDLLNRREAGEAIPEYVLQRAVKEYFPSERVDVKKALAKLPSQEAIFDAIDLEDKKPGSNEISQKLSKHLETMKRGGFPKPGTMIEVRQDVPAMYKHGIGVVTLTFGKDNGLYLPIVRFLNPIFKPRTEKKAIGIEKATLNIGMGAGKAPLITIIGEWTDDQSIPADLDTWTQVGFNPDRHSYYYERGTERQVIGGEEAVQIGNTVFVKGAIILPEGELQGTPGIRYSQFGYTGKQELLDRHKEYNAEEDTSYFADFLDVMELAIFESGTYKSPVRFLERLFEGEFDPRYQRIKQTERAFSVAAASFIDQERQALLEEVEKAYGSSTDIAANSLISQAFGSTALPLSVEEVTALREAHKKRHLAAIAAATPEAVEARAQTLIARGTDAFDAKIEAKNAIIREGVLKADQDSLADEIKARKVHTDKIVAAKNSALKKLEQQAPEVRRRVLRIRGFVDEQSRRISKNLGDTDPLRIVLDNQLGIYVTRSYQFFNDEGYRDAIMDSNNKNYMAYEAERQLAREVFQNQYLEARTLELMEEKFGLDEDGAKQQAQAEIDARAIAGKGIGDELMLRWLNSLTGGAVPEATMRPQGREDASMRVIANNLRQRKDVPKALRDLLKELDEEQGIERIIRTATTVSAIFGNQKTLSNVYKWGRSNDSPDDRWLLTRDEFEALEASDYEKSLTYKPIPVKNGGASIRNPLAGHYAPVALTEALDNLSTKEHVESQRAASQRAINGAMDFAVKATGFSMAFNVLFSLGHYARNILGYVATAIGTGRPSLIFKSAPSLKRELGYVVPFRKEISAALPKRLQSLLSVPDDKFNVERLRLVALNIDNDSVNAGTLKDMLSGRVTLSDAQDQLKSLSDQARSAVGSAVQPIMDKLGELEAATETFFKIAYFYDTLETLEQARAEGAGKIGNVDLANLNTETALYQEAARQTLMVLPSHSQTMPLVTEFTKSGFGLMLAPFLRFKSEMIRTPINNLKLATDEIKSGNSVLFKRGVARMSGMLSVLAGSAAIPTVVSAILGGIDREEDEALRKTMPKYLRDHSFFYFEFGGELKSIDLTYVNPYSGIGDAFSKLHRAAANGDPTAPIQAIATFFQNNFLDDQILAGAISALRENRDPTTGLPIYEDVDTVAVKAGKALKFLGLEAYGPRVLTDAIKVAAAAKEGVNAPGYEVKDIMMNGIMPFRIHTLDVPQQFRRYLYDHRQQYQRAGNKINTLLAKKAIAPEDIPKAYNEMVHYKKLANEDLLRTALAFTGDTLKVPLAEADAMMRDSGVSKERIANLNDRVMDRPIVSKDFVDKLLQIPGGRERGQILYDTIQRSPRFFDIDVEK